MNGALVIHFLLLRHCLLFVQLVSLVWVRVRVMGPKQHIKKEQYMNNHLPFSPAQMGAYMKRWRISFKPTMISWAATIEVPFGTNGMMDKEVKQSWNEVFPELKETYEDETKCAAIIGVVSDCMLYELASYCKVPGGSYKLANLDQ